MKMDDCRGDNMTGDCLFNGDHFSRAGTDQYLNTDIQNVLFVYCFCSASTSVCTRSLQIQVPSKGSRDHQKESCEQARLIIEELEVEWRRGGGRQTSLRNRKELTSNSTCARC